MNPGADHILKNSKIYNHWGMYSSIKLLGKCIYIYTMCNFQWGWGWGLGSIEGRLVCVGGELYSKRWIKIILVFFFSGEEVVLQTLRLFGFYHIAICILGCQLTASFAPSRQWSLFIDYPGLQLGFFRNYILSEKNCKIVPCIWLFLFEQTANAFPKPKWKRTYELSDCKWL